VGGSAANVAPAVGVLRMMGKVVCRKTLNNHFFNWMFGDFQPFFLVMLWNPPVETTTKKVVVWSSR